MDISELLKVTDFLILGSNLFEESVIDLALKKKCYLIYTRMQLYGAFNRLESIIKSNGKQSILHQYINELR